MKKVTVAIVSYNSLHPFVDGCTTIEINGKEILILSKTFDPKSPETVLPTDKNWQELVSHRATLRRVFIFLGKVSSGSLEIIDLAYHTFRKKKECLFFILCKHDIFKKEARLRARGFTEAQWSVFIDHNAQCEEAPELYGRMYYYALNM